MTDSSNGRGSSVIAKTRESPDTANDLPGSAVSPGHVAELVADDQLTVISSRAASPGDSSSEAVMRILHGVILPGERLGHFELLKYVGGGGMGKVFRALDTRLARSVALKILSPEHAADAETVQRFQNEAQSAARLDHENIARVYYVGEDRGLHYIAFEFIEGVNVRDMVVTRGALPLAEAVSFTLQVADALAHAAARNVVHRDIKPSNLLITPAGQAKLIDMGLARLREVDAAADLTASGVTLGTFDYISPEQARDPRNADVRSDIYSLGCTFFFMPTGRPPFVGGTMLQKLLQHQADQPPEVRQFRPDLPEEVSRILRKMLAKDPRHRYATPAELVRDLSVVARAAGLRPTAPGGRTWIVPAKRAVPQYYRHLPWIVSLLALIAIVFALDYLWPYLPGPAAPPQAPGASGRDLLSPTRRTGDEGFLPLPAGRSSGSEGLLPSSARSSSGGEGAVMPPRKTTPLIPDDEGSFGSGSIHSSSSSLLAFPANTGAAVVPGETNERPPEKPHIPSFDDSQSSAAAPASSGSR
jgi:serine/threonine-protein kinase